MDAPPFTFRQLDHVVLRARDIAALTDFYLGLGMVVERDARQELGLMQLRMGDSLLDLAAIDGPLGGDHQPPLPAHANVDHIAVRVDPFDKAAILAYCAEHQIPAQARDELLGAEGIGPSVYIEDPEGNRIELIGPAVKPFVPSGS